MEEYEKIKINSCIYNILDKIEAIKNEITLEKPYKYYILEKIDPIIWDAKCIKSICDKENK